MRGDRYTCPSCSKVGVSEDITMLVMNSTLDGWDFIHFNNDEFRRPTVICAECFAGFDLAFFSSGTKRVAETKVHKLMSEAFHLARHMNATNNGLIEALAKYAVKKGGR